MPSRHSLRSPSVLAGVLAAAGIVLALASCSHIAPLGPVPDPSAVTTPAVPPQHLRSPFVLEAVRVQSPTPSGGCPAGSVALSAGPGQCYRQLGTPLTIHLRIRRLGRHRHALHPGRAVRILGHAARRRSVGAASDDHGGRSLPGLPRHLRCRPDLASPPGATAIHRPTRNGSLQQESGSLASPPAVPGSRGSGSSGRSQSGNLTCVPHGGSLTGSAGRPGKRGARRPGTRRADPRPGRRRR